jgi:hypothetical protein
MLVRHPAHLMLLFYYRPSRAMHEFISNARQRGRICLRRAELRVVIGRNSL